MEIVTSWMEDGIKQGLQQGLQKGQQVGMETLLLRQINRRFGVLSKQIEARIRRLDQAQLANLGEALLDFATIDDLNNWLSQAEV